MVRGRGRGQLAGSGSQGGREDLSPSLPATHTGWQTFVLTRNRIFPPPPWLSTFESDSPTIGTKKLLT